jgi:hypothetical protein
MLSIRKFLVAALAVGMVAGMLIAAFLLLVFEPFICFRTFYLFSNARAIISVDDGDDGDDRKHRREKKEGRKEIKG